MPVILATQEVKTRKIKVQSQPRKKFMETPSQSISKVWWFSPVIPPVPEALGKRITA
jgi:hypothetical protein